MHTTYDMRIGINAYMYETVSNGAKCLRDEACLKVTSTV
jgi:hypothetical protein